MPPNPPSPPPRPTDAELSLLRILWRRGPSTVRQVCDEIQSERAINYTTVLKLLQIMTEKGLCERDESARSHVYRPTRSEADTQASLVHDLLDRAFAGSRAQLVMRALEDRPPSDEELAEIKAILRDFGRRRAR